MLKTEQKQRQRIVNVQLQPKARTPSRLLSYQSHSAHLSISACLLLLLLLLRRRLPPAAPAHRLPATTTPPSILPSFNPKFNPHKGGTCVSGQSCVTRRSGPFSKNQVRRKAIHADPHIAYRHPPPHLHPHKLRCAPLMSSAGAPAAESPRWGSRRAAQHGAAPEPFLSSTAGSALGTQPRASQSGTCPLGSAPARLRLRSTQGRFANAGPR